MTACKLCAVIPVCAVSTHANPDYMCITHVIWISAHCQQELHGLLLISLYLMSLIGPCLTCDENV